MVFSCTRAPRREPEVQMVVSSTDPVTGQTVETKVAKRLPPKNPPWKVRMVQIVVDGVTLGEIKALAFKKKKGRGIVNSLTSIIRDPSLYEEEPVVKVPLLLYFLTNIKQYLGNNPELQLLVDYLEWEQEEENTKIESLISRGLITFDSVWYLFKKDFKFITTLMEEQVGSLVDNSYYELSMFGGSFKIAGSHITTNGRQLSTIHETYSIGYFYGYKKITDLSVRPMSEEEYQELNKRGQVFKQVATGSHYMQYTGNMFFNTGWVTEKFKATGRVVIDPHNFSRFNPDYRGKFFVHASNVETVPEMVEIPERKAFTCVPIICGFSLTVKRWGQMHIRDISAIKFDTQAFELLVMDPSRKALVRSLVENSGRGFTDIISGKGGGCVFLLHGPPGTGKTLTAEAISDLLKRPLYSVTVGELGVTTKDLELRLRQILELAWEWDAVLLIDESDIFLERRRDNDIKRNALVGIFLRLLEYHQGVLFLTSNRVKAFDDAFHSRISVALHYEALNNERRKQVFENLLTAAKISGIDTNKMSQYNLNGRQIKSTIRLAQSLAISEGVPVNTSHMEKTVSIALEFQRDLESDEIANEPCNV